MGVAVAVSVGVGVAVSVGVGVSVGVAVAPLVNVGVGVGVGVGVDTIPLTTKNILALTAALDAVAVVLFSVLIESSGNEHTPNAPPSPGLRELSIRSVQTSDGAPTFVQFVNSVAV